MPCRFSVKAVSSGKPQIDERMERARRSFRRDDLRGVHSGRTPKEKRCVRKTSGTRGPRRGGRVLDWFRVERCGVIVDLISESMKISRRCFDGGGRDE